MANLIIGLSLRWGLVIIPQEREGIASCIRTVDKHGGPSRHLTCLARGVHSQIVVFVDGATRRMGRSSEVTCTPGHGDVANTH